MEKKQERDALFDNARAILIFLVVFGHLIADRLGEAAWMRDLYYVFYMFHMPAFVFITGYFSKNTEKGRAGAVRSFLIPYLVFNTLFALLNYTFAGQLAVFPHKYNITKPQWGMWFFLACFIWKVLAPEFKQLRFAVPAAFLAGLILPVFPGFNTTFTLGRVVGFLVFFVAGLKCPADWTQKIRKVPKWISGLLFVSLSCVSIWMSRSGWMSKETLYLRSTYDAGEKWEQMMMRLVLYLLAVLLTAAFLNLVTRRRCFLTGIGQNTLTVYVLHLFIVHMIKKFEILEGHPLVYLPVALAMAAGLTWLLSRIWVRKLYDWGMGLVLRILFSSEKE